MESMHTKCSKTHANHGTLFAKPRPQTIKRYPKRYPNPNPNPRNSKYQEYPITVSKISGFFIPLESDNFAVQFKMILTTTTPTNKTVSYHNLKSIRSIEVQKFKEKSNLGEPADDVEVDRHALLKTKVLPNPVMVPWINKNQKISEV